jgi:type II secretory ATPase GspE/PulE/Tfp pilus assembly ATPase PilB-like protein
MSPQQARECRPKRARGCKACLRPGTAGGWRCSRCCRSARRCKSASPRALGAAELRAEATALGHRGLRQVGLVRVADGQIALDDLLRATGDHLA